MAFAFNNKTFCVDALRNRTVTIQGAVIPGSSAESFFAGLRERLPAIAKREAGTLAGWAMKTALKKQSDLEIARYFAKDWDDDIGRDPAAKFGWVETPAQFLERAIEIGIVSRA